jgi:ferredoxin
VIVDGGRREERVERVLGASMDIRIPEYIQNGQRVLSTECILCLECINVCPKGALDATFGLDVGNQERLKIRESGQGGKKWSKGFCSAF